MPSLDRRIAAIEAELQPDAGDWFEMALRLLPHVCQLLESAREVGVPAEDVLGAEGVEALQRAAVYRGVPPSRLPDDLERGIANVLFEFVDRSKPMEIERLRGQVPDHILAAVYNSMRNYAWSPEVALRVRQLAGVVDHEGKPLPGYLLTESGCINEVARS